MERLKTRWGLANMTDVLIVLIVFALTGTTVLLLKKPVLEFFKTNPEHDWMVSTVYYILILPIYNLILLVYGFIFGKFNFFWDFEKRMFSRMFGKKQKS